MTSVGSLRSQFDHSDSPQKQQAARDAALRGAQLAFPRHYTPSAPPADLRLQTDARNAASLSAGRHANALQKLSTQPQQPSNASLGAVRAHQRSKEALLLDPHRRSLSVDSFAQKSSKTESHSNVAAVLAASRFSPHIQSTQTLHPHQKYLSRPISPGQIAGQIPEEEQLPAPGTVTDVRRWLQTLGEDDEDPDSQSVSGRRSDGRGKRQVPASYPLKHSPPRPKIVSPRPIRTISVTESLEAKTSRESAPQRPSLEINIRPPTVRSARAHRTGDDATPPSAYYDAEEIPLFPPKPSVPPADAVTGGRPTTRASVDGPPDLPPSRRPRPIDRDQEERVRTKSTTATLAPRRISGDSGILRRSLSASPDLDQLMTKQRQSDTTTRHGPPIITRKVTPHMTGDSLANAIVAGSLASSRAPSPTKSPGPGFHNRPTDKHRLSLPFFGRDADSRAASPAKGMPKTMRKQSISSSEEDRAHKRSRNPFRKHPNKHHEGDRKRWREELTELERKRYEGVWAANKGMHIDPDVPGAADAVSGLVVRDVWKRSRLPDHVLEEVWELVDTEASGRLGRAEFVVGLWLVDQRLKGRKLPVKVQPTVWRSARGIHGLKLRNVT